MKTVIRRLTGRDAAAYRAIRLRMLREHPDAFQSAWESAKRDGLVEFRRMIERSSILGAFAGGELAGTAGWFRDDGPKVRHKMTIWGVYVSPEHRGRGLGRALMAEALRRIRAIRGVEQVRLDVGARNRAARRLYLALGFRGFGVEPRAMKVGKRYVDEEMMVHFFRGR